ncbi:PEP-CTERM sorting domain-containing protein [Pseudorhodoferax soli]|uniref:Putative secreted protein with PEP-CTERM sorting signal n=1 Tax=Pseudorhodoferax soli TaxID=545864 RepID=A0A368XJB9_9BURK|nr:PEP-CTERM sorting domain-containing protein [Pseudorhodoferax soli]RCW68131.1 putative secreted protein with PEP-CTERM sorting signal [Pseudorhodoferax soli]
MKKISSSIAGIVLAATAAFAAPAQANLVTNGGFETGDFSGWAQTGDAVFDGVQCAGPGPSVYAGNCSAYFGSPESQSGIAQTIDVGSVGKMWNLSFAFLPDGGLPNSFTVMFGGKTLLSLTDTGASDYMVYQFSGFTTAENMTLSFDFFDPAGFLSLDAVTVTAVPEPATTALMGAALAGLLVMRRRKAS